MIQTPNVLFKAGGAITSCLCFQLYGDHSVLGVDSDHDNNDMTISDNNELFNLTNELNTLTAKTQGKPSKLTKDLEKPLTQNPGLVVGKPHEINEDEKKHNGIVTKKFDHQFLNNLETSLSAQAAGQTKPNLHKGGAPPVQPKNEEKKTSDGNSKTQGKPSKFTKDLEKPLTQNPGLVVGKPHEINEDEKIHNGIVKTKGGPSKFTKDLEKPLTQNPGLVVGKPHEINEDEKIHNGIVAAGKSGKPVLPPPKPKRTFATPSDGNSGSEQNNDDAPKLIHMGKPPGPRQKRPPTNVKKLLLSTEENKD